MPNNSQLSSLTFEERWRLGAHLIVLEDGIERKDAKSPGRKKSSSAAWRPCGLAMNSLLMGDGLLRCRFCGHEGCLFLLWDGGEPAAGAGKVEMVSVKGGDDHRHLADNGTAVNKPEVTGVGTVVAVVSKHQVMICRDCDWRE